MPFLRPTNWALALKSEHSYAVPIHGTTDIMVELSSARRRRPALLDLSRVEELPVAPHPHARDIGSRVTYSRTIVTPVDAKYIEGQLDEPSMDGIDNQAVTQIVCSDRFVINKPDLVSDA